MKTSQKCGFGRDAWEKLAKKTRNYAIAMQTGFSRSAAFLPDRAQGPRTYKTGPRYAC
jgi:hypothetical protein